MTKDLFHRLDSFYDETEEKKQEVLRSILMYGNSHTQELKQLIYDQKFDDINHLAIFYEALSEDMEKWGDFFLAELKRLLDKAHQSAKPDSILNHLKELAFIDSESFKHRGEFIEILKKELDNPHPTFRYYAIWTLSDFIDKNDSAMIGRIKEHLNDPDWRIRYWTHIIMRDLDGSDNAYKITWLDRLRATFLNTLKFE